MTLLNICIKHKYFILSVLLLFLLGILIYTNCKYYNGFTVGGEWGPDISISQHLVLSASGNCEYEDEDICNISCSGVEGFVKVIKQEIKNSRDKKRIFEKYFGVKTEFYTKLDGDDVDCIPDCEGDNECIKGCDDQNEALYNAFISSNDNIDEINIIINSIKSMYINDNILPYICIFKNCSGIDFNTSASSISSKNLCGLIKFNQKIGTLFSFGIVDSDNLQSFESNTFKGLVLETLSISTDGLINIQDSCFNGLNVYNLDISDNDELINIDTNAFNGLSTTWSGRINIEDNPKLKEINSEAFNGLNAHNTVIFIEDNPMLSTIHPDAFNGINFREEVQKLYMLSIFNNPKLNKLDFLSNVYTELLSIDKIYKSNVCTIDIKNIEGIVFYEEDPKNPGDPIPEPESDFPKGVKTRGGWFNNMVFNSWHDIVCPSNID